MNKEEQKALAIECGACEEFALDSCGDSYFTFNGYSELAAYTAAVEAKERNRIVTELNGSDAQSKDECLFVIKSMSDQ